MVAQQNGVAAAAGLYGGLCQLRCAKEAVRRAGDGSCSGVADCIVDSPKGLAQHGKGGAVHGVGVHHGPGVGLVAIERGVQRPLAGGLPLTVHHLGVQVQNHNVLRRGGKIIHTGGAQRHEALFRVVNTDIAAGARAQAGRAHFPAVFNNQLSFLLHQHNLLPPVFIFIFNF